MLMPSRTLTAIEAAEIVGDDAITAVNAWLARGDGIAFYRNHDLGHPDAGAYRICSFGSDQAQFVVPPEQLPDFPGEVNWRYRLDAVYRGTELEPPAVHDWATPLKVLELITDSFRSPIIGRPDRLIGYSLETRKYLEASVVTFTIDATRTAGSEPEHADGHYEVNGRLLTPLVGGARITVTCVTNERGEVDRLGSFRWLIEQPEPRHGTDANLGAAIVSVHNLSMGQ
jgi:hypothetical protein